MYNTIIPAKRSIVTLPLGGGLFADKKTTRKKYYRRQLPAYMLSYVSYRPSCIVETYTIHDLRDELQPQTEGGFVAVLDLLFWAWNMQCYYPGYDVQQGVFSVKKGRVQFSIHTSKGKREVLFYKNIFSYDPGLEKTREAFLNSRGNVILKDVYNALGQDYLAWVDLLADQSREMFIGGLLCDFSRPIENPSLFASLVYFNRKNDIDLLQRLADTASKQCQKFDVVYFIYDSMASKGNNVGFDAYNGLYAQWAERIGENIVSIDVATDTRNFDEILNQIEADVLTHKKHVLVSLGAHGDQHGGIKSDCMQIVHKHFLRIQLLCQYNHNIVLHCVSCYSGTKFSTLSGNMLITSGNHPSYAEYIILLMEYMSQGLSLCNAHLAVSFRYDKSLLACSVNGGSGTYVLIPLL